MWIKIYQDSNSLVIQKGSWGFRTILLVLPFLISFLIYSLIKDVGNFEDYKGIGLFFVGLCSLMFAILCWGTLLNSNEKITFFKTPNSIEIEKWWIIFSTKKRFAFDENTRILPWKSQTLENRIAKYSLVVISQNIEISVFAETNFDNFSQRLQNIMDFTALPLDSRSLIINKKDTSGFEDKTPPISEFKRWAFILGLVVSAYILRSCH